MDKSNMAQQKSSTWLERVVSRCVASLGSLRATEHFPIATRRGLVLGALSLGLTGLILGILLGSANRGLVGAFVGAVSAAALGILGGALIGGILGRTLFPTEDDVDVSIEFERPERLYAAGDLIRGYIAVKGSKKIRLLGGTTCLWGRRFYTYDTLVDEESAARDMVQEPYELHLEHTRSIPERKLGRNVLLRYPFEFRIPQDAAPSQHGQIVSIRWQVLAEIELPYLSSLIARSEVFISAPPPAVPDVVSQYRSLTSAEPCQLLLSMPRVEFWPGETIDANIRLASRRSFAATSIRAVLYRVEHIAQGDPHVIYVSEWDLASGRFEGERWPAQEGTTYIWLEDEFVLGEELAIDDQEMLIYAFSLHIPERFCPTVRGVPSVTWKLGVIVEQPSGEANVRVFHEVIVSTWLDSLIKPEKPASQPQITLRRVSR